MTMGLAQTATGYIFGGDDDRHGPMMKNHPAAKCDLMLITASADDEKITRSAAKPISVELNVDIEKTWVDYPQAHCRLGDHGLQRFHRT